VEGVPSSSESIDPATRLSTRQVSVTLDHVTIVTDNFEASRALYDPLLDALGMVPSVDFEDPEGDQDDTGTVAAIGYGSDRMLLWLVAGQTATSGAHLALAVSTPELVRAAHAAALRAGARIVQAPRDWESSQLNYYGTQIADLAGNRVEVVHRSKS
jgi:catechol 2,3-dioxygenase-like lactoylglutathione lyase family enzyme